MVLDWARFHVPSDSEPFPSLFPPRAASPHSPSSNQRSLSSLISQLSLFLFRRATPPLTSNQSRVRLAVGSSTSVLSTSAATRATTLGRRAEFLDWLNELLPDFDSSEEELRKQLYDGTVLCSVLNVLILGIAKDTPGAYNSSEPQVVTLKKFLAVIEELGLQGFEIIDIEQTNGDTGRAMWYGWRPKP